MRSIFLLFSGLFTGLAFGQQVEVGLMLGASNYIGDLSNETFLMKETHFSGSFFGRYNVNNRWAIKGMIGYGRLSGDDKNFSDNFNKKRNLNFYSDIYEFSVHAEYNLIKNNLNSISSRPFLPYIFGGIGVFNFNPKTSFGGKTVTKLETTDGFKYHFPDGEWLMIRASGTEPVLRVYAEAADKESVAVFLNESVREILAS